MKDLDEFCSCCNKPLITLHCKRDYTVSVLTVGIIAGVLLLHYTVCKFGKIAAVRRAVKMEKFKTANKAESE